MKPYCKALPDFLQVKTKSYMMHQFTWYKLFIYITANKTKKKHHKYVNLLEIYNTLQREPWGANFFDGVIDNKYKATCGTPLQSSIHPSIHPQALLFSRLLQPQGRAVFGCMLCRSRLFSFPVSLTPACRPGGKPIAGPSREAVPCLRPTGLQGR